MSVHALAVNTPEGKRMLLNLLASMSGIGGCQVAGGIPGIRAHVVRWKGNGSAGVLFWLLNYVPASTAERFLLALIHTDESDWHFLRFARTSGRFRHSQIRSPS